VVGHPQEWYHAPFVSRSGCVLLVHTDGPMGYPWPPRPYPRGRELCEQYLRTADWQERAPHIPWDEHPLARVQDDSEEYLRWRASPEGARWAVMQTAQRVPFIPAGRGTASEFRASWHRKG
ncbi:MAG: hypothetical protein NZM12_11090, partial [Steroidobacteraceae bacterium]|nr:hypothetical protein [Steroidobacteraceae bacterium]